MKERLDRKQFLLYALKLAFPIMIQNLISTLVNSADTIMLGYVSQTAMAASSLANQYTFVLFCFYYGLGIGTSVLCAQYFGKGDKQTVERIIGLAARVAILISLLFFAFSFFAPEAIMKIFSDSPQTIKEGAAYLKVLSFSFVFMGFSQVFVSALRSVGKIVFPSALYVVSLLVNVMMNAAFIFGLFGLPRLGVVGVALGTVSARAVEVILCFVYSAAGKDIKFRLKNLFRRSGVLFKDFLKISAPSVVNDLMWGVAATTCTAILGHIGDDMVAANAVAVMVVNMGAIVCRGFSNATTIIVSQTLGENRMEDTKVYAKRILWLTVIVSLLGCCVILAIRPFMVQFYRDKLTETAIYYLGIIMIMTTWRLVGEGINTCLICGCFRGGGDAKFGMVVDTVFMWGVSVPLMAIAAYVLKLPPVWVYFVMTLDEFEKMPVVFAHYFKFKWMKNITRDQKELEG
ncbi:MATE family efflux transporter [Lachnospiraceae bacterium OM04-12BH]|nr:MATE family efflux transporter [Lachnospiraceae bacterium OM04-12BH]